MSDSLNLGSDRVGDVCDALDLSDHAQERAFELARAADFDHASVNRSPDGVAAGAVYLAAVLVNEPQNQDTVATVVGVSTATVREAYRELAAAEGIGLERVQRGRNRIEPERIDMREDFFRQQEARR